MRGEHVVDSKGGRGMMHPSYAYSRETRDRARESCWSINTATLIILQLQNTELYNYK